MLGSNGNIELSLSAQYLSANNNAFNAMPHSHNLKSYGALPMYPHILLHHREPVVPPGVNDYILTSREYGVLPNQ